MKAKRQSQANGAGRRSVRGYQPSRALGGRRPADACPAKEPVSKALEERARELALPGPAMEEPPVALEWIEFAVAGWRFALELPCVAEVTALEGLTPVPGAPAWLRGIVNLRGQVHSVMDLETLLGLGVASAPAPAAQVLVLADPEVRLGLLASRVEALMGEALESLKPVGERASPMQGAFLRGASLDGALVLEPERLLEVVRQPWGALEGGAGP